MCLAMNQAKSVNPKQQMQGDVWFVYDGDCPICCMAANALQIKKTVGNLHVVNAREDINSPLIGEINEQKLNLDDGMVLKFQGVLYHGEDALHMMALLGSPHGWFNRMNAILFRSKKVAKFCYPMMRSTRNLLLRVKRVGKINNLQKTANEPIFKSIFGSSWGDLPPVLQQHYFVRPYSNDIVIVEGTLNVRVSIFVRIISRLTGMLIRHSGDNIPVTITFRSDADSRSFHFDRIFHFPNHGAVAFHSHMEQLKDNIVVDFMRFGVGWKMAYIWDGKKVILQHKGYVLRIAGFIIPLPLSLLIGKGYAEEVPLSDNKFNMRTYVLHPLFGKTFGYDGTFEVNHILSK
jgi:predicted DCC family thiol-disulfide oxidoreductase YuxK